MAKLFKFEKVKVGSIVIAQDAAGSKFKMQVTHLFPDEPYPIITEPVERVEVKRIPSAFVYMTSESWETGLPRAFTKDGWYTAHHGDKEVRIIGIKKPWKEFTEGMELEVGMEVRIKLDGKWIKGVVGNDGKGYDEAWRYSIEFEHMVHCPGNPYACRSVWAYTSKGEFIWNRPKEVHHLRVRKYK